jgi:SAM-dependent methyltransferase
MADVIKPYLGAHVLEIGAGMGNLTKEMLPRERYVASDFDPIFVNILNNLALRRSGVEVTRIDASKTEDFEHYKGAFDTVICLNVLEHIKDARTALSNFYGALSPQGRLVILVPQGPYLYSSLDKAVGHVKRYTRGALLEELTFAGYTVEHIIDFNRVGVLAWIMNAKMFRRTRISKLQMKIYDSLTWMWRVIDPIIPWPGLSLIAIAARHADN